MDRIRRVENRQDCPLPTACQEDISRSRERAGKKRDLHHKFEHLIVHPEWRAGEQETAREPLIYRWSKRAQKGSEKGSKSLPVIQRLEVCVSARRRDWPARRALHARPWGTDATSKPAWRQGAWTLEEQKGAPAPTSTNGNEAINLAQRAKGNWTG